MWISKTPLRLSFLGGGTDLPAFFEKEEGATLSGAFDKYIYVSVHSRFDHTFRISYESTELCQHIDHIVHPVAKAVLAKYEKPDGGLDVVSYSDIPAGTGLGSSSCFTVGLLNALHHQQGRHPNVEELAREACEIEFSQNKNAIGRQDQYAVTYGGLNVFRFTPSGEVHVEPLNIEPQTLKNLEDHIVLFYTGLQRPASKLLKRQSRNVDKNLDSLRKMRDMVFEMRDLLEASKGVADIGILLNEAWRLKKTLAEGITNTKVDRYYSRALEAGAYGGKLMGAGAGGFMMFLCEPNQQKDLKESLKELDALNVRFDFMGSRMLEMSEKKNGGSVHV